MLRLAANLAESCRQACVIYLYKVIRALAKPTFSRGFIQGLGHVGKVKSPTYYLGLRPYEIFTLAHFPILTLYSP